MVTFKKALIAVLAIFIIGFTGYIGGRISVDRHPPEQIVHVDTTIVVDTNIFYNLPEINVEVSDVEVIEVPKEQLVFKGDSLVVLPMEKKTYQDKGFTAQISGYHPNLDWIQIYPETKYVTKTITSPPKRWGLSLQGGMVATLQGGQIKMSPGFSFGVSWSIIQW